MHAAADSGCDENAQLMYELANNGVRWLQRKFLALRRWSGDGRDLSKQAPLAMQWYKFRFELCTPAILHEAEVRDRRLECLRNAQYIMAYPRH
jgi:hypothetical protein